MKQDKFKMIVVFSFFMLIFLSHESFCCRMWGEISINPQAALVCEQLQAFREYGSMNINGWGFAYYPQIISPMSSAFPVLVKGGPKATADLEYPVAVKNMLLFKPRVILGHVRTATSGHFTVPNPHPFRETVNGRTYIFCHNGTIDTDILTSLVGQNWLLTHKPDWYTPYIDSEIWFKAILKAAELLPLMHAEDWMTLAADTLDLEINNAGLASTLNCLMSDGKNLFALRYADTAEDYYTLYYLFDRKSGSYFVCSEPLSGENWVLIPNFTLAVFCPFSKPEFIPVVHHE